MAKDGTVIIYTITPGTSEELKRVLTPSSAPRFNASMVATASESQIIVYSLLQSSPRFNIFNLTANEWTGPDLINQLPIVPEPGDGSGGNGSGGNGTDSGNSSSGTSNTAIIGGAVAGVLVLVLIAAFFIVRRKRQRSGRGRVSQKHSSAGRQGGGGSEGSSNLGAEEIEENKPVLSDYQQQQNRASLQMAESSRGSIMTLNSSSTAPLVYAPHRSSTGPGVQFAGHSQPGQLTSAPLTVPQQLQLQQQQIQQQQQQQQQQSRRGVSSQGMELLSLPVILEQHSFEQHSEGDDEEQLRKLEQESPFVARPYSNVTSFSYPTVYQDQPRHQHQPVRTTVINPYSGASVVDDEEQEPYVLPDPIIVAPTPVPHKAELLE
ncbi:hypothetical protein BGZ47_009579 [Haplosporangium gracile]|nr:hypothetical protein BGZ47_009579 [Haplosporangium gracile]